jgi:hypothetical protein
VLRVGAGGSRRWYFKTEHEGRRAYLPIGDYAPPPRPGETAAGFSLDDAREEARRLANLYRAHGDVKAHLAAEREAKREAEERDARERAEADRRALDAAAFTVRRLCDLYCDHLQRNGKAAHRDARGIFTLHVYPRAIADLPARELQSRDVATVLRELVEAGKARTAGKLRSYLRAAFAMAARAELDATAPAAMLGFGLTGNPVASVPSLPGNASTARDRTLTAAELRHYWRRVKALEGVHGDALRLQVLLGGQRVAQLVRAEVGDFDAAGELLTLRDPKGRRSEPRRHTLPLVGPALGIAQRLAAERRAAADKEHPNGWRYLLASEPDSHTRPETLDKTFAEVLADMREAGELENGGFQLRDVRRTAETLLAAEGVAAEVRAHLQSHGLGGVQQRHYVKHDFMPEKRAALLRWHRLLGLRVAEAPKAAPVAELAKARRAKGAK